MPHDSDSHRPTKKQARAPQKKATEPRAIAVPIYCHDLDPKEAYPLAECLGRAVALDLLDAGDARAALMLFAVRRLGDAAYDPRGLSTRLAWALNDAVSEAELRRDMFPQKLTWALVDRLRGLGSNLSDDQQARALNALEALVLSIYERERRPIMQHELGAVASAAFRSARQRIARERGR